MGHKKKQMILTENPGLRFRNISPSARNLSKTDLGSVIFGCKHSTYKECLFKQLFGLPSMHYAYVRNVRPGMPLFLFNYSDRKLHGIFEAQSEGKMNINPYAWTFEGDGMTQFPAQVKVRIRQQLQPLTEDQFKPIIAMNYYERSLFWFELDKTQTQQMIALFMKSAVPKSYMPQSTSRLDNAKLPTRIRHQGARSLESGARSLNPSSVDQALFSQEQKELSFSVPIKSWCSLFKHPPESKAVKEQETAPSSDLCDSENSNIVCPSKVDMDCESIYCSDGENMLHEDQRHLLQEQRHDRFANIGGMQVDGSEQSFEENHMDVPEAMIRHSNEDSVISDDDTKTILSENSSHQSNNMEWGFPCGVASHSEESQDPKVQEPGLELSEDTNDCVNISGIPDKPKENSEAEILVSLSDGAADLSSLTDEILLKMTLSDLRRVALKLLHATKKMKSSQLREYQTNHSSKQGEVQSENETEALKENLRVHESSHCLSAELCNEQFKNTLDTSLKFGHSILLVGGYDGCLSLLALDSFEPTLDNVRSLKSMDIVCTYASSVQLNNKLYVLGGDDGKLWHDTVQSYNLSNDRWVSCPSLRKKRGSLAGIGLNNKIFAMGGGNATDCFRDVEMLDLGFGKWIRAPSMREKRFGSAAAEVRGMVYVVGGYDGKNYLRSVEGFDPRERSWTGLQSMNIRRGCHSVTVLNEKLFAIGGYDGEAMVPSVEIFDPRFGSWRMAEPMNNARGYFGATTFGSTIYAIGGFSRNDKILASVECYSEGYGWELTNLKSVGKRAAFSAVSVAM